MALPTLDATFASSADLPRKQMLAKWLVEELGETQAPSNVLVSGLVDTQYNGLYVYDGDLNGKPSYRLNENINILWSIGLTWTLNDSNTGNALSSESNVTYPWLATGWFDEGIDPTDIAVTESPAQSPLSNYYSLPERYLWAKIAVAAGGPKTEADYISLPKNYAWSDIYNAVAGLSGNHTDWSENVALGHIAAAYRGDTGNPANLATYIDWPWRYQVASIITSTFAEQDPYFSNVSLLMHFDGDQDSVSFNDSSLNNFSINVFGDSKIDTTIKKIGSGSGFFDGDNDYLEIENNEAFEFSSEDFTIEFWIYPISIGQTKSLISKGYPESTENESWTLEWGSDNELTFFGPIGLNPIVTTTTQFSTNNWYHLALIRDSGFYKIFVNGELEDNEENTETIESGGSLYICAGWFEPTEREFSGYIDELRITKGIARYSSNFTPQTSAFPNQ